MGNHPRMFHTGSKTTRTASTTTPTNRKLLIKTRRSQAWHCPCGTILTIIYYTARHILSAQSLDQPEEVERWIALQIVDSLGKKLCEAVAASKRRLENGCHMSHQYYLHEKPSCYQSTTPTTTTVPQLPPWESPRQESKVTSTHQPKKTHDVVSNR